MRQKLVAGKMSERFPEVQSLIITMRYRKGGAPALLRTLNYYPASYAFFKMSCLEGCADGELDITRAIRAAIKGHDTQAEGRLSCKNKDPAIVHADIDYNIVIKYARRAASV